MDSPAQFDAMRVVHQAVEDAVGDGGVADLLVPLGDRNLRSQDRGSRLIAFFSDLPEVTALGFLRGRHGPVVDDENIDADRLRQESAPIALSLKMIAILASHNLPWTTPGCMISQES